MMRLLLPGLARLRRGRRGVAAVEFALVSPVLLLLAGGTADYALTFKAKGMLASSVAAGAQYAALVGPTVSTADVRIVVQQKLSLPDANVTVTAPACYCLTGVPAAAAAEPCGVACDDGTLPSAYLTIAVTYAPVPATPGMSRMIAPVLTDGAMVRFK